MAIPVHILVTCRKEELLKAATMVFETLRVGFPTAPVKVLINCAPNKASLDAIVEATVKAQVQDCEISSAGDEVIHPVTIHHEWIQGLLERETEPFFILDTDVCFWDNFEQWDFSKSFMAGKWIPAFEDDFTKCVTQTRLHPSLLYLNPQRIKEEVAKYFVPFPDTPFNPRPNLIFPAWFPVVNSKPVFFDTMSLLYQAIGGSMFNTQQIQCYDHLNFATISDIVAPHYPNERFREQHFAIFENPALLRGAWREQDQFYRVRRPHYATRF